jgi:hypothetical protein
VSIAAEFRLGLAQIVKMDYRDSLLNIPNGWPIQLRRALARKGMAAALLKFP